MVALTVLISTIGLLVFYAIMFCGNRIYREMLYRNQLQEEQNSILRNNYFRKGNEVK